MFLREVRRSLAAGGSVRPKYSELTSPGRLPRSETS
jgi:hypothetical protein